MLDDYQKIQPVAYRIIMNEIKNKNYSHAYILEANGFSEVMSFAIAMAKTLFCAYNDDNNNIIELIDTGNFPELKIIDPEGLIIKKEDIEQLQVEFSKKPIYSDKKIYIINNANRLNSSSANSLLKFLEEPNQAIIAILICNNVYQMMDTIISRCQIINMKEEVINHKNLDLSERICCLLNRSEEELKTLFASDNIHEYLYKCIDFVDYYEKHKMDTFIYLNKLWFEYYKTKEAFDIAYQIMLLYYTDILRNLCGSEVNLFIEYINKMNEYKSSLNLNSVSKKIMILIKFINKVKQNNNLNLLMDKLLIEFGRCDGIV